MDHKCLSGGVVCGRDYLLGSTELHWRYGAELLMHRLLRAVRPGGYLLVVGIEPYDMVLERTPGSQDRLVLDIEALGDTAAALAVSSCLYRTRLFLILAQPVSAKPLQGESTYRELPESWVQGQVERASGFRVVAAAQFPMRLTKRSLSNQLAFARKMAAKIDDAGLRAAFDSRAAELETELGGGCSGAGGQNYAIVVQHVAPDF